MSDIIERAEAFLTDREPDMIHAKRIIRDLITALKVARAERNAYKAAESLSDLNYSGLDRSCDSYYGIGE